MQYSANCSSWITAIAQRTVLKHLFQLEEQRHIIACAVDLQSLCHYVCTYCQEAFSVAQKAWAVSRSVLSEQYVCAAPGRQPGLDLR